MLRNLLRLLSGLLLIAPLAWSGCKSEQPPPQQVFIQINERRISPAEFDRLFAASLLPDQQLKAEERADLQRSFLVQLIDRELIAREARERNIVVTPAEVDAAVREHYDDYPGEGLQAMLRERGMTLDSWREELRQNLVMEKLLREVVYARVVVAEEEVAAYYEEHRADFDRPEQVRARQIMVTDEAQGKQVLGLLRQGEDFTEVARQYSQSPDARQGGDLGFFGRGQMPGEFDAVVFDLPVGRLSKLVKSDYGYHIFLVEEIRPAARLSQKEAEREIRRVLEAGKQEEAYQNWLQELRSRASIEVNWDQLDD